VTVATSAGHRATWREVEYYDKIMALSPRLTLLPEEDALDDDDVADDVDPTVPGDLWFLADRSRSRQRPRKCVVYSLPAHGVTLAVGIET
jgi:hypothetical protein